MKTSASLYSLSQFIMRLNTDSSRAEVSYLRVVTEDADSFDKVAELYFEARDNANDEEAYDSPWDEDDSSESSEESNEEEDSFCITSLESDLLEKAKVTAFATTTCNCKFGKGEKPCSASLSLAEFVESRNNCHELTSTELDLVILGAIQSSLNCNKVSISGWSHKHCQQTRMAFYYHSERICNKTLLFLHCLNKNRFCSLVKHYTGLLIFCDVAILHN